ncbi:MAG: hypothetical protein KAX30_08275 [Candidatus Atribacteria bacterium]|nr:hypothetical protein [Candidatus Atribacteria bacterium]
MDIIKETIKELESLNVNGTLSNVIITKMRYSPWTLSYVKYDDGIDGCGLANNELKVPDDVAFIESLLNLNVYDAIDALYNMESSVFINSLIVSTVSALSHRLMNDEDFLRKQGYEVESVIEPCPLLKFVRNTDVVVLVEYNSQDIPFLAEIAKEVNVIEPTNLGEHDVIDFNAEESNMKIISADKSEEVLSKADVVSITGETLVNGTIDEILQFSENARTKIIYGPTSSFYPKALFERGIDASVSLVLSNTPDFKRQFVLSDGFMMNTMIFAKHLLVKRSTPNTR